MSFLFVGLIIEVPFDNKAMFGPLISWYFRQRYEELQNMAAKSADQQEVWFEYLLDQGKNTEYGETNQFKKVKSYTQWKNEIPVAEYETLKPYIERTMLGEQALLWPGEITWFAKSSGTTSNTAKFIPISFENLEETHFKGSRDILSVYCNRKPESAFFEGKGLLIGGSHKINQLNTRSFYGDLSAVLMNHMPYWVNMKSTPDLSIALMDNWEEKVESMAKATIGENVTSISGVPTWTLVLFKKILELTGKSQIHEVWPNLELFIHGGVSFTPYKQQFQQYLPLKQMQYLEIYNASEGFFGIQYDADSPEMLLMTDHGVFFEFFPVGEDPSNAVPSWEVQTGVNYGVLITTNSGLWRYNIGDTVQFSSTKPLLFKITGRTKLFINAFGEELVIENADKAISRASEKTGAVVADYTAAPVYMSETNPGHEWLIEFEKNPDSMEEFTTILDQELKHCNSDYAAKRQGDLAMKMPSVHEAPRGIFNAWLKSKGKLGGQHKVPRLSNNRQVIEELLGMMSSVSN